MKLTLLILLFSLIGFSSYSQTTDTTGQNYFLTFVKKVYLNPTILLRTQQFREANDVRVMLLPDMNGQDDNTITGFERAFQKLIRFLIEGDDEGSVRLYFDASDQDSPYTFVCSDELYCKFSDADKDSIENRLNAPFSGAVYNLNSHALFEASLNSGLFYIKKCLDLTPSECGDKPDNQTTQINTKPLSITVKNTGSSHYDIDHKAFSQLESYYAKAYDVFTQQDWYAPSKFLVAGDQDELIAIGIAKHESLFKKQNFTFKIAGSDQVLPIESQSTNDSLFIKLPKILPAGNPTEIVIKYKSPVDSITYTVGFFMVQVCVPKEFKLHLIGVNGANVSANKAALEAELKKVYDPVGVTFVTDIKQILPDSDWPTAITIEPSGLLSNYPADLRDYVHAVQDISDYESEDFYVVFGLTTGSYDGYMPRARNIGFIFSDLSNATEAGKITAHELGHGVFHFRHLFAEEELGESFQGSTENLMDYCSNPHDLYLHQWMFINDPAFVSWFGGDDEDAAFNGYMLTPDWKVFSCIESNTWTNVDVQIPNGVVYAISKDNYSYRWNGSAYSNGTSDLTITIVPNPQPDLEISLIDNKGICGRNMLYKAPWDYVNTIRHFDPKTVNDPRVKFSHQIPCVGTGEAATEPQYDRCKNLLLSDLNAQRIKLENISLNWTAQQIADTINSVDECAVYDLDYNIVEGLLQKIGKEEEYSNGIQAAMLVLLYAVDNDRINNLYTHVLSTYSNRILKNLIKNMEDYKDDFLVVLKKIGKKVDNDEKKWTILNELIRHRYDEKETEQITAILEEVVSTMSDYYADPVNVPAYVASFQYLTGDVFDEVEDLNDNFTIDFKQIFNIAIVRSDYLELFSLFTQSDYITIAEVGFDCQQTGALNWLVPESISLVGCGASSVPEQNLKEIYFWSEYLYNHPDVEDLLDTDPALFFQKFKNSLDQYITDKKAANSNFWNTLQLTNCNEVTSAINHVRSNENTASLRIVDKNKKLLLFKKIFECGGFSGVGNNTSSLFGQGADVLTKLATSFSEDDQDILIAVEQIGFKQIYDALSGERLSNFCVWAGTHAIQSGRVFDIRKDDVLQADGNIVTHDKLLQLESNIFQFDNFSANVENKTKIKIGAKSIPYNQMVLVYVADDFTFLDQQFKQGSVLTIPMIQAFAMSESNRSIVTEKSIWLGVDILSFAIGIGEVKIFFTVGNYLRKTIVLSDLIGSGAGTLANSLNESYISPDLRYKLQMLSVVASIPQLATSFKKVNTLVNSVDASINQLSGISTTSKTQLVEYFSKIKSKLYSSSTSLFAALDGLKSSLGFRPGKSLNFTGFSANTGDDFIDIIIHFKDGKFVISKESGWWNEINLDQLADIINNTPSGKNVRLLSCNDLDAAKQLSSLTNKPFYASNGWVDLYPNGQIRSGGDFHKFENGVQGNAVNMSKGNVSGTPLRLGLSRFSNYSKIEKWLSEISNASSKTNIENILKSWNDNLLSKLENIPSRNPLFFSKVEANPDILNHFETGAGIISSKGAGLKPLELDMYALDKARTTDIVFDGSGNYIINPTRKNLAQMNINNMSGKIRDANGNIMVTDNVNSEGLMYVIDDADNIFIGGRNNASLPHPTLIGGKNPNVKCAGMIRFKDGRILEINNNTGHFKTSSTTLDQAETIFKQKMPANSFDSNFKVKEF